MESVERLAFCLKERTPVLVLGAGFSRGATNYKNIELPKGNELAKGLYQYCYIENPPVGKNNKYIKDIETISTNLRELCTVIASEKRTALRNEYFKEVFSRCKYGSNDFQRMITSYNWDRIFTLNIDDLVEFIYKKEKIELSIWYGDTEKPYRASDNTELFKLHGCITKPEYGFVFDDKEYQAFTADNNYMLREFGESYIKNDIIFVGTEFQESDLLTLIQEFSNAGYDAGPDNGNHYFFVSPSIGNRVLNNDIENTPNMHWINMTTEAFLKYITDNVSKNDSIRHLLHEKGGIFLDELFQNAPPLLKHNTYTSNLYIGAEPTYFDVLYNWDIIYPGMDSVLNKVLNTNTNGVFSIYGKSFVGKTCIAKRSLLRLQKKNYITIELKQCNNQILRLVSKYIDTLPPSSKIGILIENSAYQYHLIADFLNEYKASTNDKQIIFITTDLEQNHLSKRYILADRNNIADLHVSETISGNYATNIFNKLNSKKKLGNLLRIPGVPTRGKWERSQNKIINYIRQTNDVIDVLYFASEGRHFEEYFKDYLDSKHNKTYVKYLQAICTLGQLGITEISSRIVPKLIPEMSKKYNINAFKREYDSILSIQNGAIHVRCMRIIQKTSKEIFGEDDTVTLLKQVALQTIGLFSEKEYNEWSAIFQKALKTRVISKHKILSDENTYLLLNSLQSECSHISYYWVQRGIAAQQLKLYEDANNHLLYAKDIRPNSYQVKHALAKNLMERGLYELDMKNPSASKEFFEDGCNQMEELILSPDYSDAYRYSVHAYTDMMIKYSYRTGEIINKEQFGFIENLLLSLQKSPIEVRLRTLTNDFIRYCESNSMTDFAKRLKIAGKGLRVIRDSDNEISNLEIHLD